MKTYRVVIPVNIKPSPSRNEISAANLLTKYFKTDVEFIVRSNHRTPDFLITGIAWVSSYHFLGHLVFHF